MAARGNGELFFFKEKTAYEVPGSAVGRVPSRPRASPEKNRGLESVLEGAQRGTFQVRNGAQWGSSPRPSPSASLRTADLYRVNFEVQQLKPFAVMLFRIWSPKKPVKALVLLTNW